MAHWSDPIRRLVAERVGDPPDPERVRARWGWVEALHTQARAWLEPAVLAAMPAHEAYERIRALSVPGTKVKVTNLGRVNDAERVKAALLAMMTQPGDFRAKYRAAKIPQAGVVTITEVLCVAKPMRFVLRNTAFTRAMAKVVPLYSKKALDELPYEEFLDTCGELAKAVREMLTPIGMGDWARDHRFLLLYAILTEAG